MANEKRLDLRGIGRGRIKPEMMKGMLEARDRRKAGPTAPPQGLFLVEVGY